MRKLVQEKDVRLGVCLAKVNFGASVREMARTMSAAATE